MQNYLLSTYYVLGIILDIEDTVVTDDISDLKKCTWNSNEQINK